MLLTHPASIAIRTCVLNNKRTMSTSARPVSVRVYINSDQEKESIINENKGRSGIYRWEHIDSGKSYIGSAKNLSSRFKQYFNYNHISYPKRNMTIYKSLLKHGYAKFRLEILEYCSTDKLLQREQFYFDNYNPEYNILKIAGSPLGYRHCEAAKARISLANKNKIVSESTRDLKRKILLGKTLDSERLEKMRLGNVLKQSVLLTNTETGDTLEYSSITDAGKFLGISRITVSKYLLKNLSYKGYTFAKATSKDKDINLSEPLSPSNLINQQRIRVTNKLTGVSQEFASMTEAAEFLEISRAALWYFFKNSANTESETIKGYSVSKITDSHVKVKRKSLQLKVTGIDTNEVVIYPSLTLAAEALGVSRASISGYLAKKRTNAYKNKYYFKLV